MFWDENNAFPDLRQRGHSKRVVSLPSSSQKQQERLRLTLLNTMQELSTTLRLARPEANRPFSCHFEYDTPTVLCRTNGLYNVRLVQPDGSGPSGDLFPYLKVELNNRYWNSCVFGSNYDAFNEALNKLPKRERIPYLVEKITQLLPS